jgi:hypothetical protein
MKFSYSKFKLLLFSCAALLFTPAIHAQTCELASYFKAADTSQAAPDSDGFIRRWKLLDPIDKSNRSNAVFTDSYLREAFADYPGNAKLPRDGQKITYNNQSLQWHALDSQLFNVKLFRFASCTGKQVYGVLFWAVTEIICDSDIDNIRLAVGSNSASMWWLNGDEALLLSGDRRMVMDDALSRRISLKKGSNILRGAIINGPGMSDFCVRFLHEDGTPVTNIKLK